jgi:hypothetical protein
VEPFTSLEELVLNRVPPSTVEDIYSFRHRIYRLEVVNSGIPELIKLLAPGIKKKYWSHFKPMQIGISPALSHAFPELTPDSPPPSPSRHATTGQHTARSTEGADMDADVGADVGAEAEALYPHQCWQRLTHLRLCNCGIARLDPSLHFLPHLKLLDLSHNDLSHVTHLHHCPALNLLNLSFNRLSVLSNLHLVVANIQRLNLAHNLICMLDGISHLRHLVKLDLSHNLLDDPSELEHLVSLLDLRELYLEGNPMAASRHTAAGSARQEQMYRCEVFGHFMHDCSLQHRPLPLLDGREISPQEEVQIK